MHRASPDATPRPGAPARRAPPRLGAFHAPPASLGNPDTHAPPPFPPPSLRARLTPPRTPPPVPVSSRTPQTTPTSALFGKTKPAPAAPASAPAPPPPAPATTPTPPTTPPPPHAPRFRAFAPSAFAYAQLAAKGPRANADVGAPVDAGLPFVKGMGVGGVASCGSWGCTEGGWLSPTPRASTEWFYVIAGRGSVSTADGRRFGFGPGDVVVLPKGWAGRWDVTERIHKIYLVHEHEDVPGASTDPTVATFAELVRARSGGGGDATRRLGDGPGGYAAYDAGSTRVGSWSAPAGTSIAVTPRAVAECAVVLRGAFFLTNGDDGSARKFGPGDVVAIPEGWRGDVDVVADVVVAFAEAAPAGERARGDVGARYQGGGGGGGRVAALNGRHGAGGEAGERRGEGRGRGLAGAGPAIYESGPAAAAEGERVRLEVCLRVLETSDDAELVAKARETLMAAL